MKRVAALQDLKNNDGETDKKIIFRKNALLSLNARKRRQEGSMSLIRRMKSKKGNPYAKEDTFEDIV